MISRVFIDTNVWFSAFYGSPNPNRILIAHVAGKIQGVISQKVLHELIENISQKIPLALPALRNFLEAAPPIILANPTTIPAKIKSLAHPKDQLILAAAAQGRISLFVTGNTKDFNSDTILKQLQIEIITPAEMSARLK